MDQSNWNFESCEKFGDEGGMAAVEIIFRGFEFASRVRAKPWAAGGMCRRDSVAQLRRYLFRTSGNESKITFHNSGHGAAESNFILTLVSGYKAPEGWLSWPCILCL